MDIYLHFNLTTPGQHIFNITTLSQTLLGPSTHLNICLKPKPIECYYDLKKKFLNENSLMFFFNFDCKGKFFFVIQINTNRE